MKQKQKRTKKIYGNWKILAPDGELLFLTLKKRAEWYLKRDLAKLTDIETIQLTFEPKNRSSKDDKYNLAKKENKCVVCGSEDIELLTRHHIVPYEYRKYFPEEIKSRSSHDVVPICREHHNEYELIADDLKKDILLMYDIINDDKIAQCRDKALKYAKLLLNNKNIPIDRLEQIRADFVLYSGIQDLSESSIIYFCENNKKPKNISQMVVEKLLEKNELENFVKMWRKHFIKIMNPKYMPEHWSIDRRI